MIPDEAVEVAARAIAPHAFDAQSLARAALEAALPYLLSHVWEETRLTHIDAVVNAEAMDILAAQIERVRELHVEEGNGNCVACWDFNNETGVRFPCPTIAALG